MIILIKCHIARSDSEDFFPVSRTAKAGTAAFAKWAVANLIGSMKKGSLGND